MNAGLLVKQTTFTRYISFSYLCQLRTELDEFPLDDQWWTRADQLSLKIGALAFRRRNSRCLCLSLFNLLHSWTWKDVSLRRTPSLVDKKPPILFCISSQVVDCRPFFYSLSLIPAPPAGIQPFITRGVHSTVSYFFYKCPLQHQELDPSFFSVDE